MKCQILFSRKRKKNIISLSSAEFDHRHNGKWVQPIHLWSYLAQLTVFALYMIELTINVKHSEGNSADGILKYVFFYFYQKISFDVSCKLSLGNNLHGRYIVSLDLHEGQTCFLGKDKKKYYQFVICWIGPESGKDKLLANVVLTFEHFYYLQIYLAYPVKRLKFHASLFFFFFFFFFRKKKRIAQNG